MTTETLRLLIESPELLTTITLDELRAMTPLEIKELPEPRLLVTRRACGTPLGVVFPIDDYLELHDAHRRVFNELSGIEGTVSALRRHVMVKAAEDPPVSLDEPAKPTCTVTEGGRVEVDTDALIFARLDEKKKSARRP